MVEKIPCASPFRRTVATAPLSRAELVDALRKLDAWAPRLLVEAMPDERVYWFAVEVDLLRRRIAVEDAPFLEREWLRMLVAHGLAPSADRNAVDAALAARLHEEAARLREVCAAESGPFGPLDAFLDAYEEIMGRCPPGAKDALRDEMLDVARDLGLTSSRRKPVDLRPPQGEA